MKRAILIAAVLALAGAAFAHEVRPAYLEITQESSERVRVLWKQPVLGEVALPLRPRFPASWRELPGGRLSQAPDAIARESFYDPGGPLAGQVVAIDGLAASITDAMVRVTLTDQPTTTHILRPATPSLTLGGHTAPPRREYLLLGIKHILLGIDHLLFVLGLLVIVGRDWRRLVKTITAFTVAHSLTLAAATLGAIRVPAAPLNAAIALSILFLGIEIARQRRGETSFTIARPWAAAFGFGLLHGLGFASGLSTLGLPPRDVVAALLLFNVGVELGQLAFVGLCYAVAHAARTLEFPRPRWSEAVPGYLVGTLGAYWTIATVLALWSPR